MKKLILFCLLITSSLFGQISQGPKGPTAATGWTNPTNIFSLNGVFATYNLLHGATSPFIASTGYGFTIPGGAQIKGIYVAIFHKDVTGNGTFKDNAVYLLKAGAQTGSNKAQTTYNWASASVEEFDYGSGSDLWGTTWTASDINDSRFGAALQIKNFDISGTDTAGVDYISIIVYYSPSGSYSFGTIIGQTRTVTVYHGG